LRSGYPGLSPWVFLLPVLTEAGLQGKFDPRDFSGIYIRRGGNRGFGPPNGELICAPMNSSTLNPQGGD
jgi:hypothetical protein